MQSFGELLTTYMSRTGISDSELARHLGVSRQTIFRWKEGHTTRPRVRDDIIKIAARLRLSDAERDALLLSAGMSPQNAPLPIAVVSAATPQPEPPGAQAAALPVSNLRPRRLWIAVIALVLFASVALSVTLVFVRENEQIPSPTPVEAQGEQIILLGRLQPQGGNPPNYDVTARVRQAIEREIDAARLERVRVLVSPNEITDTRTAETVRTRSGATLALWGSYQGSATTLGLVAAFDPNGQTIRLESASAEDLRALALVLVAKLAVQRGAPDAARAALTQALAIPNLSADLQSNLVTQRAAVK
jgi:transcriptional regulator with XRE-family HTH domain